MEGGIRLSVASSPSPKLYVVKESRKGMDAASGKAADSTSGGKKNLLFTLEIRDLCASFAWFLLFLVFSARGMRDSSR